MGKIYARCISQKTGIISVVTFEEFDMRSGLGMPTLDQLRILLTVVEVGSFAGAARLFHQGMPRLHCHEPTRGRLSVSADARRG
ncbi:LysR family transcriptional regulator [Mesorhizobium sp. B2-4-15]|uniref:LysR family transcriptional regulator n=1 Tax=Mesorhizobium sp. B2-4-15 TaxID=2589934 RepID=UPI001FEE9C0C|nr:LysR family transcriptional regulator [Mesorhizobium sp. B2-4-15]